MPAQEVSHFHSVLSDINHWPCPFRSRKQRKKKTDEKKIQTNYLFVVATILMQRVWKLIKTSVHRTISLSNDNLNWIRPFSRRFIIGPNVRDHGVAG